MRTSEYWMVEGAWTIRRMRVAFRASRNSQKVLSWRSKPGKRREVN